MKKLRNAMEFCTEKELEMANNDYPLFRSDHEGVAIIEEEVYETEVEMQNMVNAFNALKIERVYGDMSDEEKKEVAEALKKTAQNLACEAVQTAAMAQKFIDSMEARNKVRDDFIASMTDVEKEKFVVKTPSFLGDEIKDRLADIVKAFDEVGR